MSLENEAMGAAAPDPGVAPEAFAEDQSAAGLRFSMPDLSFLKAPTGEGPVESYIDDPLNFDHTKSTARILRGCSGIFGALDYALIDIGIGILEKAKERKRAKDEKSV